MNLSSSKEGKQPKGLATWSKNTLQVRQDGKENLRTPFPMEILEIQGKKNMSVTNHLKWRY